ncbi:DUF2861 family protein [Vibrio harveyi]|nr:DUF2861 family protein [Vibrio harveyi]
MRTQTYLQPSPLEHTYQATLTHQPQLAWQELFLALRQNEISSKYWVPIKNELLSQTACGTELSSGKKLTSQLTLGVIRRFGLTSQGYQIRLSVEQYTKINPLHSHRQMVLHYLKVT